MLFFKHQWSGFLTKANLHLKYIWFEFSNKIIKLIIYDVALQLYRKYSLKFETTTYKSKIEATKNTSQALLTKCYLWCLFQLVLELCRSESTANPMNIQPHMKVIQNLKIGSNCGQEVSLQLWWSTELKQSCRTVCWFSVWFAFVAIPFTLCHLIYWKYFFKMEYTVIHMKKSGGPTAVCQVILVILTYFTKRDTPLVLKRTYWKGNKYQRNSKISMVLHTDNCLEL